MRGQGEVIVFILLFMISIVLFVSATFWSKDIFQQNVDVAKVKNAENFIRELDSNIQSIIKFGGSKDVRYTLDGTIGLVDNQTIEVRVPVGIPLPTSWINLSADSSHYIQERLEGDTFKIQLKYPDSDYSIDLFTDGTRLAVPSYVSVERNRTLYAPKTTIRIKITFA